MKSNTVLIIAAIVFGLPILACGGCVGLGLVAGLFSDGEDLPPIGSSSTARVASQNEKPADETALSSPFFPGTEAVDVYRNFESRGFKTESRSGEWTCRLDEPSASYRVDIFGQQADKLTAVVATASGEFDHEFFRYVATIPYDFASPPSASAWVADELGTNAEKRFGAIMFRLSAGPQSASLRLSPN